MTTLSAPTDKAAGFREHIADFSKKLLAFPAVAEPQLLATRLRDAFRPFRP
jgi:hypothetical protein